VVFFVSTPCRAGAAHDAGGHLAGCVQEQAHLSFVCAPGTRKRSENSAAQVLRMPPVDTWPAVDLKPAVDQPPERSAWAGRHANLRRIGGMEPSATDLWCGYTASIKPSSPRHCSARNILCPRSAAVDNERGSCVGTDDAAVSAAVVRSQCSCPSVTESQIRLMRALVLHVKQTGEHVACLSGQDGARRRKSEGLTGTQVAIWRRHQDGSHGSDRMC